MYHSSLYISLRFFGFTFTLIRVLFTWHLDPTNISPLSFSMFIPLSFSFSSICLPLSLSPSLSVSPLPLREACTSHYRYRCIGQLHCLDSIPSYYRPLSRRLDRCDRMIQNESRYSNGGNVCLFSAATCTSQ